MRVRLSAKTHNPADPFVPRFDLEIPIGGAVIEVELTDEQIARLQDDLWITVEKAKGKPSGTPLVKAKDLRRQAGIAPGEDYDEGDDGEE